MILEQILTSEYFWLAIGFGGQIFFTSRFLVQWIASEKAGKSVMPVSFWFLSIGGSLMLLAYAIHRRDPVFTLGQSCGSIIYVRNLHLIHKERLAKAAKEDIGQFEDDTGLTMNPTEKSEATDSEIVNNSPSGK